MTWAHISSAAWQRPVCAVRLGTKATRSITRMIRQRPHPASGLLARLTLGSLQTTKPQTAYMGSGFDILLWWVLQDSNL